MNEEEFLADDPLDVSTERVEAFDFLKLLKDAIDTLGRDNVT